VHVVGFIISKFICCLGPIYVFKFHKRAAVGDNQRHAFHLDAGDQSFGRQVITTP